MSLLPRILTSSGILKGRHLRVAGCWIQYEAANCLYPRTLSTATMPYRRKDFFNKDKIRHWFPLCVIGGIWVMLSVSVYYSKKRMRRFLPQYLEIRDELSVLQRMKLETELYGSLQSSTIKSQDCKKVLKLCDGIMETDSVSDACRAFVQQLKGIALFTSGELKEAEKSFSDCLKSCTKAKIAEDSMIVLHSTYYLSLIAIAGRENVERGLKGLLYCCSKMCALRPSWEGLEHAERLSNLTLAINILATYTRVLFNLREKIPLDEVSFRHFVAETENITDEIYNSRIFKIKSPIISATDQTWSVNSIKSINDLVYLELEKLKPGQNTDFLTVQFSRLASAKTKIGRSEEGRAEVRYIELNEVFREIKKGDQNLEAALRQLNAMRERAENEYMITKINYCRNEVLRRLHEIEQQKG